MSTARMFTALIATILTTTALLAHDGHTHKVMGTVSGRDAQQIALKTPGGEVLSIAVNDKTVVTRNKKKVTLAEVQKGVRAVIDIGNGEDPLVARGIELGVTITPQQ